MTDLSTRPSVTGIAASLTASNESSGPPLLVGLSEMLTTRWDVIGARAARLSLATRSCLPVPAGSVLTSAALGCFDRASRTCWSASADTISGVFDGLGRGGQIPLMVSVSAVSPPGSAADRIVASHAVSSRSELLHTVRRLSATASMLGEEIAVVVQRDVDIAASGTLVASASPTGVAESIRTSTHVGGQARLIELGRRTSHVFGDRHTVTWAIDRCDQLWILDLGPDGLSS